MRVWILSLLLVSVAAFGYEFKISLFTRPPNFLREFPLGEVVQADVIASLGLPKEQITLGTQTMWAYEFGEGYGRRTYTFVIEDGVVVDVIYNDQGPYNGITAKQEQSEDQ